MVVSRRVVMRASTGAAAACVCARVCVRARDVSRARRVDGGAPSGRGGAMRRANARVGTRTCRRGRARWMRERRARGSRRGVGAGAVVW